jgi:hypothetical protein
MLFAGNGKFFDEGDWLFGNVGRRSLDQRA